MYAQYYFLVTGLPDLLLDEMKTPPSFSEVMDELESWVEPVDAGLLQMMRLPYDNYNLITVLESRSRLFDARGRYSPEELTELIKNPGFMPDYMETLTAAFREGRSVFPDMPLEDQLAWLFYDEMTEHGNPFIREWYSFERDLRNLLAVAAVRSAPGHLAGRTTQATSVIVGRTDSGDRMARSSAPDLGVGTMLPWAERILGLSRANLIEFEKGQDLLRWEMLDTLTVQSGFGIEMLCAFSAKLAMVQRWLKLDASFGRERLEQLCARLQAGYGRQ